MNKFKSIIIISAILVILGIGLTIYESLLINENIANEQQNILSGESISLTKDLYSSKNQNGIYSVKIIDFKEGDKIKVTIFNPTNYIIASKPLTTNLIQENFPITVDGMYKIQIENQGAQEIQVLEIIGSYPQITSILDILVFIILITGVSGVSIGIMYLLKNRNKANIS